MKYFISLITGYLLFSFIPVQAQKNSHIDRTIVNSQARTAAFFRLALENNMPDSALKFIDKKYLAKTPALKEEIIHMANILSRLKDACLPRYSNIIYSDTATIFSFLYTVPPPRYTLLLSFEPGNKDFKISQVNFKSQAQVDEEEKNKSIPKPSIVIPPLPGGRK
jgi:hypothetical protein